MNTPLLVLSQYVYAKRQNGGFYSGRIEGRESENSYNISFSDYTRSTVSEDDLVWLGFYSLPPESWPKSPTIHPVKPGETVKREVNAFSSRRPDSLKFLKDATKEWVLSEERKLSSAQVFSREHYPCTTKCESIPTRSTDRTHSTQRTSVLRLNRKALSKEISQEHTEDSSPPPPMQDTRVSGEMMTSYNDRNESSTHHFQNPSQCPGSPRPSYDRYDPPYFNTPCLTPPSTPVPTSLPPPLFACNPYDPAVFGDMWPHVDSRDIGGGKRRRRDSMKKCRKVYGIDNRSLWCTQCKWKKACTRFQMANFGQRVY